MTDDRSPEEAALHEAATQDDEDEPDGDNEPARPNLIDRTADRIDAIQRGIPPVAVVFAVTKKYGDDRGGQLAMLLAYKGFFSLFPLLLAFVTLLGLLLSGNPELRDELIDSTLASIPVVGNEVIKGAGQIDGSIWVLVGAVLVSLWAGLGLLDMLQEALNTVWDVVQHERPPWIVRRLRDVPGAILIALCAVASGAGRWLLADGASDALRWIVAALLAVLAGAGAYLGLHLLLCTRSVPMRSHLPGVIATGLGWWGLQALGGWYVTRFVRDSSDTYGVFVVVLGLLSWTYLLGMMYLYSVELAAVLHERRWPRSLSGRDLTDADLEAFGALSEREARVPGTEVDVVVPRDPQ